MKEQKVEIRVRIDKFLWAVRIFKTRALSVEACDREKVRIGGQAVKPSRHIKTGDIITLKLGPFEKMFKVLVPVQNRLPAKLVPEYCREITPLEEIARMKAFASARAAYRQHGLGRPTKKERRELDDFTDFENW